MLYIKIAKYIFAVSGGFLLAAEAIKIQNLQILAYRIRQFVMSVYPVLKWMAGDEERAGATLSRTGIISLHVLAVLLGGPVWIALQVGGSFGGSFRDYADQQLSVGLHSDRSLFEQLGTVIGIPVAAYATGVVIITLLVEILSGATKFLTWVESNTESGAVGISGFLCFLLSVVLDVIENNF